MPYSTKQRQAVLRCLAQRPGESVAAADLAEDLRRSGSPVGLATIYRQLERLEEAGQVHKVNTAEGALYQYCSMEAEDHRSCCLLRCRDCGRVLHLDCAQLQDLRCHLETAHHFRLDLRRTVLTGQCGECRKREET